MAAARVNICRGLSWLPPASPGGSPRSASGSDPGFLQIPASVLGLRVCEILHEFFKGIVCLSYTPLALPYTSSIGLQSQTFWLLVFTVQEPDVGSDSLLLRKNLYNCDYLPFVGWVLTIPCLCPYYLSHCGSFFICLVMKNHFYSLGCSHGYFIHSCNFVCPWEEVQLRAFLLCHLGYCALSWFFIGCSFTWFKFAKCAITTSVRPWEFYW